MYLLMRGVKIGPSNGNLSFKDDDKEQYTRTNSPTVRCESEYNNKENSEPDKVEEPQSKLGRRRASLATRTLRIAKQAILLRRSYQWNQGNDPKVMASFCPSFLLREISQQNVITPHTFFGKGACLIADISGFVKLCGRLSALGVNGIDGLRKCTNSYIGDLVNTVYRRGGDVVSFAGDAIICVFMANKDASGSLEEQACCRNVIQCAEEIKNHSSADLNCHVAVSYGELCFAILGGYEKRWTYLINGDCLTELAEALNDAASKEAVATATCFRKANFVEGDIRIEKVDGKYSVKVHEILNDYDKDCDKNSRSDIALIFAEISSFVPPPVTAAVGAGSFDTLSELRQVTTLFLKLDSYCIEKNRDLLTLQQFYCGVQELLADTGGFMRQFLVDDKGCVLIAIWGVPGTIHPNNSSRALHCGVSIMKFSESIGHQCSIGVTTGDAYCGTVGSEIRRDYVAMGDSVNLAARLMCKAKGRLLMDGLTRSELPLSMSSILKKGEALMLKGRTEPLTPFVYSGADLPPLKEIDVRPEHTNLFINSEVVGCLEREVAKLAALQHEALRRVTAATDDQHSSNVDLENSENSMIREFRIGFYPSVRVLMLEGSSGSGKKNAVKLFTLLSTKHNFRNVSFRVSQSDGSISYGTIRKLFLLLIGHTNFLTEANQRRVLSQLFSDCYPDDDEEEVYRKHFPMVKFVLNLEWDYDDLYSMKVSRPYEFAGDATFQELLVCVFKRNTTTVVIEDIHFCDELSWRDLICVMDMNAPVLMLFTGLNTQSDEKTRKVPIRSHTTSTTSMSLKSSSSCITTTSNLPQVSVAIETRRETKASVYEGLSALDDGTRRENMSSRSVRYGASALLKKACQETRDYSLMKDHENCTFLEMPLLSESDVIELLQSTLGVSTLPVTLAAEVLELSGGSAYWSNSIANYIKVVGIDKFNEELIHKPSSYDIEDGGKLIEDSTKSKTAQRLEKHIVYHLESLSVKLQSVAKYASVIGDEFHLSVLFEILPSTVCVSINDLSKSLDSLNANGIVDLIEVHDSIYAFQNEQIRQTLTNLVLPSDADNIHYDIAKAFEKLFVEDLRPHYPSLSYHYAMSHLSERGNAFKYTVNAADQQIGNGNFQAGYLYLEYAASFVKYDTEMAILYQVTEIALFDLNQQSKRDLHDNLVVNGDIVANFEDMKNKFCEATSENDLNGATILHAGSYSDGVDNSSTPINMGKLRTEPCAVRGNNQNREIKNMKNELKKWSSAKNAKYLRMPSYSAKHHHNKGQRKTCVQNMCCCVIS